MGARRGATIRYRGLHFPEGTGGLPPDAAEGLREGTWQAGLVAATFALATTTDRALVLGAGAGHIPALLSGKLGLPFVWASDADPDRRAYLARLAEVNGLARLAILAPQDTAALSPTLLLADLGNAAPLPDPRSWPRLRAAAFHVPHASEPGAIALASLAAMGLALVPALSANQTLVFARSSAGS